MPFRLQFSLRMLLFLMAVIAVGLAVYRWPWVEATVKDYETTNTTYRRAWYGVPLRNGRTWTVDDVTGQTTYDAEYANNQLLRERFYGASGLLAEERSHDWPRREHTARDYSQWAERGIILEKYRNDIKREMRHEWKMPEGTVLESHFGTLRESYILSLAEWNGRTFTEEMNRVLADLPTDNDRHAWATQPQGKVLMGPGDFLGDNTYLPFISKSVEPVPFCTGPPTNKYPIQFDELHLLFRQGKLLRAQIPIVPGGPNSAFHHLLIAAHQRNCTLRVRFGIVTVVPIGPELLQNHDPTGALAVKFFADSAQAKAWLEPVVHMRREIVSPAERLDDFFAGTGIDIDASQLNLPEEDPRYLTSGTYLRPRRDVLGTFLLVNNYRVEQQGNRLVLLPR